VEADILTASLPLLIVSPTKSSSCTGSRRFAPPFRIASSKDPLDTVNHTVHRTETRASLDACPFTKATSHRSCSLPPYYASPATTTLNPAGVGGSPSCRERKTCFRAVLVCARDGCLTLTAPSTSSEPFKTFSHLSLITDHKRNGLFSRSRERMQVRRLRAGCWCLQIHAQGSHARGMADTVEGLVHVASSSEPSKPCFSPSTHTREPTLVATNARSVLMFLHCLSYVPCVLCTTFTAAAAEAGPTLQRTENGTFRTM